jgi:hypothetical protein
MRERIPEPIPDLPESPERRAAKDAFLEVFLETGRWEREGDGHDRSALVLLGQVISIAVDTDSIKRLTARLRHFLENEAVRRDFCASLEAHPRRISPCPR